MGVRVRGFTELIRDLETLPERADKVFPKVVSKGALNIKTTWRRRWDEIKHPPTHIPRLVSGIGYDTDFHSPKWSAEIGVASTNSQAPLAHLIEFGSIHNAPHPAGKLSLDEEEPRFVQAVADAAVDLLDGT
jgi:hypothetical protein